MKITATGKRNNKKETIIFENGKLLEENLYLEMLLESPEPLGGTYYPDKWEGVNVYYTLKDRYFDDLENIAIDGELGEIPAADKENVVY